MCVLAVKMHVSKCGVENWSLMVVVLFILLSAVLSLEQCSRRTSDNQGAERGWLAWMKGGIS